MQRSIILAIAHWISPASNRSKWPTSTWENSAKLKPRLAAASAFSTSSNVVGGIVGSEMALATHLSNCYYLLMDNGQSLCLACADLDRLVFLPAGDTALSRRSRKHSSLAAVVVRFNRKRKRYERQSLLVTEEALAKAEEECVADAPARAAARGRATLARQEEDREFVSALAQAILQRHPGCPTDEARRIAEHTGCRSSGRVGRSAAGRALDASAVDLAVIAHIRHEHTNYDKLLMSGTDRLDARALVREAIDGVLAEWSGR